MKILNNIKKKFTKENFRKLERKIDSGIRKLPKLKKERATLVIKSNKEKQGNRFFRRVD